MSSEPPEEPLSRSEYNILSPASPKPIHFPAPTNIPILDMQTDVGFNQMEPHMSDPSMRNTETRPDMWQDPSEQHVEPVEVAATDIAPYPTTGDLPTKTNGENSAEEAITQSDAANNEAVAEITGNNIAPPTTTTPNFESSVADQAAANGEGADHLPTDASSLLYSSEAPAADATTTARPEDLSTQNDEVKLDQAVSQPAAGAVDIQGLLNTLQTAPTNSAAPTAANGMPTSNPNEVNDASSEPPNAPTAPGVEAGSSPLSASHLGVPPSGLPPRPPPQEQPLINPNYAHSQHIRDYHPHAAHSAYQPHGHGSSQGNAVESGSGSYIPPVDSAQRSSGASSSAVYSPSLGVTNGQASYAASPESAAPHFISNQGTFSFQYGAAGGGTAAGSSASEHAGRRPEDRPWNPAIQRKYDLYLKDEGRYVAEGRWEQFPQGSRLFVGNLSSEKVTKRDIFHVFHTYGELAQISIKQAYGFVQFLRAEDCLAALQAEQGTQIRDKRIHLEISKPQKNRPQPQRRSRSPPDQRNRQGASFDRYNGARAGSNRRDDYRPTRRSPSPRGYRDRYDDRYRRRSPSPQGYGGRARGHRDRSPRREDEDDLPLPRRQPSDVPDVQIIVLDTLDRDFISWVEKAFSSRSVRVDVLLLSPRLDERAVVRRQIVEGVLAVVKLTRQNQETGMTGLQIFDRIAGAGNVRFEEYDNLPPATCVELVLREKGKAVQQQGGYYQPQQHQAPVMQPQYGAYPPPQQQQPGYPPQMPTGFPPNYQLQQQQPPPQQATVPPHLQQLMTNLDTNNLQSLLSSMGTPQSAQRGYGAPPTAQTPQGQYGGGGQASGAAGVNMQDILARLGK